MFRYFNPGRFVIGATVQMGLTNEFWERIEPSLDSYSGMIDQLLGYLSEEDLREVVEGMRHNDGDDDDDEEDLCDE